MTPRRPGWDAGIRDRVPVIRGAVLGAVAYVAGYIATALFAVASIDREFSDGSFVDVGIDPTDAIGWAFYNTHFVDVQTSFDGGGILQPEPSSGNLLSRASSLAIPEPIWYLIPVVILIGAGFLVARSTDRPNTTGRAITAGGTVFVGYLPLATLGVFLFRVEDDIPATGGMIAFSIGPGKAAGILLAGLVYPLALGAIGGLIASVTATSGDGRGSDRGSG